jgi:hypothetical protein
MEPTGDGLLVEWAHDIVRPKPLLSCATNGPTRTHPRPSFRGRVSGNVWNRRGTARTGCRERDAAPAAGACVRIATSARRRALALSRTAPLSLGKSNRRPPASHARNVGGRAGRITTAHHDDPRLSTVDPSTLDPLTLDPGPVDFGPVDLGPVDHGPVDLGPQRLVRSS